MQKISSYLYPNRIQLLADLAGFTTEYTNVYQRTVKIYKGVDNVLEFDIKNADQKKIELVTSPTITNLQLNVMDMAGNALPNSPYTLTPVNSLKGIATATIPAADVADLDSQFFRYSVTATKNSHTIPLYADSKFGAIGTMELVGTTQPTTRKPVVYDEFVGEINLMGNVITHSSAIPCKFYEAVPTETLNFSIDVTNFMGTIYLEGTKDMTISVSSFRDATHLQSHTYSSRTTTTITFNDVAVEDWNYFRISWVYPNFWSQTGQPTNPFGTVDKITVS